MRDRQKEACWRKLGEIAAGFALMDLLVEFVLNRRPLSLQTDNRAALRAYKTQLTEAARESRVRLARPRELVYFSIGDFHWTGNVPDADNIIKPAQDAMRDVIFEDDRQVCDSLGYSRRTLGLIVLNSVRLPSLMHALAGDDEFIHIAVSSARAPHFQGVVNA